MLLKSIGTKLAIGVITGVLTLSPAILTVSHAGTKEKALGVEVNGQKLVTDVPPVIVKGRMLLPLRVLGKALGAQVTWDAATQKATVKKEQTELVFSPGGTEFRVNGQKAKLDVAPRLQQGRMLIPGRILAEKLGFRVFYHQAGQEVSIDNRPAEQLLKPTVSWQAANDKSIRFILKIKNEARVPVVLNFNDGQDFDAVITRNAKQVYRWSDGKVFTAALRDVEYRPGEERQFTWEWKPGEDGKYLLEIYYLGIERGKPVLKQEIEVK